MTWGSPSSVCQISPPLIAAIHFTGTFLQGYAFVQFTSPFDARSACLGEDAKSLCGQTLDVNMVSEPKAHISKVRIQQIQIKRQYWRWQYVKVKAQKRQKEKGEAGGAVLSYYMAAAGEYSPVIYLLLQCQFNVTQLQCTLWS